MKRLGNNLRIVRANPKKARENLKIRRDQYRDSNLNLMDTSTNQYNFDEENNGIAQAVQEIPSINKAVNRIRTQSELALHRERGHSPFFTRLCRM